MIYADAHIHISDIFGWQPLAERFAEHWHFSPVCACAHSPAEWERLVRLARGRRDFIVCSLGIHPQNPQIDFLPFLEKLFATQNFSANECSPADFCPDAIGEAGFDLFNRDYAAAIDAQEIVWQAQLELSEKYGLPLIVHCRRALDRIFRDSKKLSRLRSVIFHSFSGSPLEARSLLKRHIGARFSLGKAVLNGNKRALACAAELPLEVLLAETDAPYQTLRGENVTLQTDIKKIYEKLASIKKIPLENICAQLLQNFTDSFGLPARPQSFADIN